MVTREFLLDNGFYFRIWDGSKFPDGEYTKRLSNTSVRIGYSDLYKWSYEISNYYKHITFHADRQESISVKTLQTLIDLADIKIKLIRHI
jgi:hypothetical protein